MTANNSSIVIPDNVQPIVDLVLDSLNSPHSKHAYGRSISEFLAWWQDKGRPPMVKAIVQKYKAHLQEKGLAPATVNLRISAIRKLAAEAADNGLIPQDTANAISKVKGAKSAGVRVGNWLTKDQAQILINTPDTTKIKGLRDRAMLAVMVGTGLRRSEVANLEFRHIQQREGRWVIVDLVGKGNRVRTVPIPSWVKVAIDEWSKAAGIKSARVFRGVYHYGNKLRPESDGITPQAIYYAVQDALNQMGYFNISPHDLRRTFAKLAHKGGADLGQIQLTLGHASLKTTERYLCIEQDLHDAPCDRLGLDLTGE